MADQYDEGVGSQSSGHASSSHGEESITEEKKSPLAARKKRGHQKPGTPISSTSNGDKDDPLGHLPEHEQRILRRQLDSPAVEVTIRTLYRYATRQDMIVMTVSGISAVAAGAALPLMTIVFGNIAGIFQQFFFGSLDGPQFSSHLGHYTLYFVYLAIGEFITTYIATVGFIYTGEHITQKIREQYLVAIMRQNIGFFDKLGAGEITTRITADTALVQDGISQKVGLTLTALASFVTAFVIGFVKYWKLTLILMSTIFAIASVMGGGSRFIVKWSKQTLAAYAAGGTVAEEVLSSIRNATAFSTQDKLARQYDEHLTNAERSGFRQKSVFGVMFGVMSCFIYLSYALAFWQGSRYLVAGEGGVTLSTILTILLSIQIGSFSLGNVAPNVQAFTTAVAAAAKIYSTIDRKSPLDPSSTDGKKLEHVDGNLELKNVKMIYPSRPEVVVMQDVNLFIPASKTTALVGASGSGKSTIVGLVERFYDPVGGEILLDGQNIQDLNLQSLRRNIALVSQEPTLFSTTIFANIAHGLIGSKYESMDAERKRELVIDAARMANAHDFVTALPQGYETNVGERGFLLSGGQKQRIAIARAVVGDPRILLLDEATSALDTKSEGVVQAALDKAAEGRTTVIIAHRLSTIKTASNIVVMSAGRIVEQGTHDELLQRKSAYFNLVEAQKIAAATKCEDVEEVETMNEKDELVNSTTDDIIRTMSRKVTASGKLVRTITSKSVSSMALKNASGEETTTYSLWTLIRVVAGFNKPELKPMLVALFASIICGAAYPVQSVFFAKSITALSLPPPLYGELRSQINFWSWMYFMLALVQLLAYSVQGIGFAYCSEKLIHRARDGAFRHMLRQDIGFFDREENTAGALTSFLSTETTRLAGLSGSTLGTILNVTTTLVAAMVLALAIGWKLALVCISTMPILLGCGFFRFWMLARFERKAKQAYEKSASYACEATSAIRTVASLTREQDVWENYHQLLLKQAQKSLTSNSKSSLLYAVSQSFMFLCFALGFWYGGTLIAARQYSMFQFFVCFTAIVFGTQSAGVIFSFAPDMSKAKQAAHELKTLYDRRPAIDSWSTDGEKISSADGAVEFRDVHFRYPTRPEQPVLRGLNISVSPGQYVALVGASGCGKSTTIGLLERFYDPLAGGVYLDGVEISSLNISNYRNQLALVSQEPTLYQGTIRDNILLGADRPDEIDDTRIIQACKDANIYTFILSLPDGFSTVVGNKGVLLSGGQKQRLAIARALMRNPKVLLLDEATSALDSESEKVVQAALDQAAKGRTTIAVAHRLSTIQKADCIFVFESGVVVEQGTHAELMGRRGRYFELVNLQSLEKMG